MSSPLSFRKRHLSSGPKPAVAGFGWHALHGTPRTPEELPAHRCVNFLSNRNGRVIDWQFERDGRKVQLTLDGVLAVNDQEAYVLAGVTGLGIVKVAAYVVRPYLESGQLIEVLGDWTGELLPISVMYPQSRQLSAKVRVFVDWVSELLQKSAALQVRSTNASTNAAQIDERRS